MIFAPFLVILNIFRYQNFSGTQKGSPSKFSVLWDNKFSIENRDMPPLIHKFFSIPENFRKTEGFLHKAFRSGTVRQKKTKPRCPPPSYAWKLSIKEVFWNTKVFSNEIFRYSETKTSTKWYPPPLIHKLFFPTRNFLKHRMVPWRSFFGPVR